MRLDAIVRAAWQTSPPQPQPMSRKRSPGPQPQLAADHVQLGLLRLLEPGVFQAGK